MKKIILLLAMIVLFSISVSAYNETYNNITIYFSSGGTMNMTYTGLKNFSYDYSKNWIQPYMKNASFINYTISAGQHWAIWDNPEVYTLPYRNISVSKNINFTNGIFYFLGTATGVIYATTKNVIINLHNLTLISPTHATSTSYAIYSHYNADGVKYLNGNLINYSQAMRIRGDNSTINNFIIKDSYSRGITLEGRWVYISNSTLIYRNFTAISTDNVGIYCNPTYHNITVDNVFVQGWYTGINWYKCLENTIKNSYFNSTDKNCIQDRGGNTSHHKYINNIGEDCGHNFIDLNCKYALVENNTCIDSYHHCIDTYNQASDENASFSVINHNFFNVTENKGANMNIIYSGQSNYINISNNYFYNCVNGYACYGIALGSNTSSNFNIFNNKFYYSNNNHIYLGTGRNVNIYNNLFYHNPYRADGSIYGVPSLTKASLSKSVNITNNFYFNDIVFYSEFATPSIKSFVNFVENTTYYLKLNLSSSMFYFDYSGLKNLSIVNNTITSYHQPNYNSYCNSTVETCQRNVTGTITETLGANKRSVVVGYDTATEPYIYSLGLTTYPSLISYDSGIKRLQYSCTGAGSTIFSNMYVLRGGSGYYVHYIDGTPNGYANTDTYTQSTCSLHTYSAVDTLPLSVSSPMSRTILISVLAVMIVIALLAYSTLGITKIDEWDMGDWLRYMVIFIVILFILTILVQIIFGV